jgi:RimJ/RimL family protein N-acetyltransferase
MQDRLSLLLRDGTPVIVRPLTADDRPMVATAYSKLTPEARYHRFWTQTGEVIGAEMLDRLVSQDPSRHLTWAVLDMTREFHGMGGASWWRSAKDPSEAEISLMVFDTDQCRGIGTLLLAVVWISAFRAGITRLVGYCLTDNRRAADWMRDCGGNGEWDGYKLIFTWDLGRLDALPVTAVAADLAAWLAELSPQMLDC